jgi:hypothetical protein
MEDEPSGFEPFIIILSVVEYIRFPYISPNIFGRFFSTSFFHRENLEPRFFIYFILFSGRQLKRRGIAERYLRKKNFFVKLFFMKKVQQRNSKFLNMKCTICGIYFTSFSNGAVVQCVVITASVSWTLPPVQTSSTPELSSSP